MLYVAASSRRTRGIQILATMLVALNFTGGCSAKKTVHAQASDMPSFDVVSVKQSREDNESFKIQFTADGFTARNVTVLMLLQEAYGMFEDDRITGIPKSFSTQTFDIEAKIDPSKESSFEKLGLAQRRLLLQQILADRFQLVVKRESRDLSTYELQIDKNGFKPKDIGVTGINRGDSKTIAGTVTQSRPGLLQVRGISMASVVQLLTPVVGRPVIDKTGLLGRYDFSLHWIPDELSNSSQVSNGGEGSDQMNGGSIFSALREQLGLKLVAAKAPIESLTVVRISQPSEN